MKTISPTETIKIRTVDPLLNDPKIQHLICDYCYPLGKAAKVKSKCGIDNITSYTPNATQKCVVCLELVGKPCPYCGHTPDFTVG